MYNIRTAYPNEIFHHGVKNQKWGIRRYQNPDGSLTREGKLRYKRALKKRRNLEVEATMSARTYVDRQKRYEKQRKKYDKAKEEGSLSEKQKLKLENAKKAKDYWKEHSSEARKELENHVKSMTNKYGDKKIKDINYVDTKYGKQVAGKVLTGKDVVSASLETAVITAITLPTIGVIGISVPSSRAKTDLYARKQEHKVGIKSPIIGSPKKLKNAK